MAKRGTEFECVVRDVIGAMDPQAIVRQGEWVEGPDGRRDMDVSIEGAVDGVFRRFIVECKDFNPQTSGPVGIGFVDALDSKRRDLATDAAFICSNAGFTGDAIRKAKRVGIGLIAVLNENDERLRYQVVEEIYIRQVRVESITFSMELNPPTNGLQFDDWLFDGKPVGNWVRNRAIAVITANPIVLGNYDILHDLIAPIRLCSPFGSAIATKIDIHFSISGGWYAQKVELKSTAAIYDWLRRRIRVVPGPWRFGLKDFRDDDFYKGKLIDRPPESELAFADVHPNEMCFKLLVIKGCETREPVPNLDQYVSLADLKLPIPDLPIEASTSNCV